MSEPSASPARPAIDLVLRGATIAGMLAFGAIGIAFPGSLLCGGGAWLCFLLCVCSGWGHLAMLAVRAGDTDFGLRAAWGIAAYLAVGGVLLALGVCSTPAIYALIAIGVVGFVLRELTAPIASWHRIRDIGRCMREHPALAALALALVLLAVFLIAGAIATLDANPWDDDLAYTPFVKRLLDRGDLIEPFSYRRLGAYGGQTLLGALAAVRGSLETIHLADRALCFTIALLVVVGFARERRTHFLWIALLALVLLLLPPTAINTASYWSGVVLFLALYRTALREQWVLLGVVGAMACTLRQNFLVVVAVFVAGLLVFRIRAKSWKGERLTFAVVAAAALLAIVPWWIAAQRSSATFLFPIVPGTFNHELSLAVEGLTWADELGYLAWTAIESMPIVIVPLLFVVSLVSTDPRIGRPATAMLLALVLGFGMLGHSFVGTENHHIWRYLVGPGLAFTAILVVEIGAADRALQLPQLGRWLLLASLVLQLLVTRASQPKRFVALAANIREAAAIDRHGNPSAQLERHRYTAMQTAIPEGARVVVMLDDPAYLDYARNEIASLDTPGFASPSPQLPMLRGAEPLRAYLVERGYRYAAFVRSERSRYFFRRGFWLWRLFNDGGLYRAMSAYTIDAIDSFAELATTTTVLYDVDGLVVLDLGAPRRPSSTRELAETTADEATRRDRFVQELAVRENLVDVWRLSERRDVRFADGIGGLQVASAPLSDPAWWQTAPQPEITNAPPEDASLAPRLFRGYPFRTLDRRSHLRVRGDGAMQLEVRAAIALNAAYSRPRLDVSLDGTIIAWVVADDQGRYTFDVAVAAERIADGKWHDLYFVFNSISEPERDVRDPRIARLEALEWRPAR